MMTKNNLLDLIEKETDMKFKHPLFDDKGNPQCCVCGKPFIQVDKYSWRGDCSHISKDYLLSHVGESDNYLDRIPAVDILRYLRVERKFTLEDVERVYGNLKKKDKNGA